MTEPANIIKVNQLKAQLDDMRPLSRQAEDKLWQKLRLEWDFNSNHIEGNTLTYGETMLLLLHDKTTGDHQKREYDEMQAHDVAIHMVRDWAADKERDISEADIKNLNRIILVKPYWKEALTYDGQPTRRQILVGDYKQYPNSVRLKSGEMFHYATPEETPREMQELMDWYKENEIQHPVYLAAELHYRFIRIHPFDDGNGRVARLLVNYVLMRHGYTPIIIKSADKENYLTALQKADAGDRAAFWEYIAQQQIWSLELELKAAKGESIDEPEDIDKEIARLKKEHQQNTVIAANGLHDSIYHFIEGNIIPLFEEIDLRCSELSELFLRNERTIMIRTEKRGVRLITEEKSFQSLMKEILKIEKGKNSLIMDARYSFAFDGLKTAVEQFRIIIGLEVFFERFHVRIVSSSLGSDVIYPYSKTLSKPERLNLIAPQIKEVLNLVKQASDH
ncbi:MAG: Fic family protein [Pseudobacter sp.]|uniref:Fic family protein n=1 Tax=Pseudobacter sp. TaxID=2045420 RepID=UPI003F8158A9